MVGRRIAALVGLLVAAVVAVAGVMAMDRVLGSGDPATEVAALQVIAPSSSTPSPTTTTTTTSAPPPPPLRTATLAFTGDTLAHRGVVRQAAEYAVVADGDLEYDFAPMYRLVEPYLASADVAICHLETPLSPDNRRLSGYPTFNVPGDLAAGLAWAGYDGCTVASNHSLDRRADGVVDTLDVLDAAGLAHSGMARSAEERMEPPVYDAAGIAVANLSYTYGLNGFSVPADSPWLVNVIDVDTIVADAASARAEGAEVVIVSIHWGTEYRTAPNDQQLEVAAALAASGEIDAIVGHHAHVVQPVEWIGDVPVVYGLGNFLSNQSAACCVAAAQDGAIAQLHIQEVRESLESDTPEFRIWLTWVPTWVDRDDFTITPVVASLGEESDLMNDSRRRSLERSLDRTETALESRGSRAAFAPPLVNATSEGPVTVEENDQ